MAMGTLSKWVTIQEIPERTPPDQLPRSIDVIHDGDMVDRCKPGVRIQLVGIHRSIGSCGSGTFRPGNVRPSKKSAGRVVTLVPANTVTLLSSRIGRGIAQQTLSGNDINKLTKRSDIVNFPRRLLLQFAATIMLACL
ncbi:hypothetical protein BDM02DRAFT_841176 [Thelephora ganbajun]|uniref:Uncharacterized protein n=1 Tax=Thelephora ganbajun TaxID=370292 RepID=A0ACB6Z5L7_THEGA|nr:hypothetical protein BDM02DRAFT_841176 [Thelephora ganbajun]